VRKVLSPGPSADIAAAVSNHPPAGDVIKTNFLNRFFDSLAGRK